MEKTIKIKYDCIWTTHIMKQVSMTGIDLS
jgi:hypothetical protein